MKRLQGKLCLPSNEFDHNPIHDVQMMPIDELSQHGFSETFIKLVNEGVCKCRELPRIETKYWPVNIVEG